LYEATFDAHYLDLALRLSTRMHDQFLDPGVGGYFMTAADGEALLVRPKEVYDGAVPSGNSVAMTNMARLSRLSGDMGWDERARAVGAAFSKQIAASPMAHTYSLVGADFLIGPTLELVVSGRPDAPDVAAMRQVIDTRFLPSLVTVFRPAGDPGRIAELAPYVRDQTEQGGVATAYLCRNFACERPVTDPAALAQRLDAPMR
jgi:uncharacterized protein YyaL (SSP411 family)